ncbi:homeobox protein, cut isoform X3 [Brevipalpus obovatus]|uniref:homeobox protein, cut isoform X3 n=1 Tax=Brevipalpus obovatus TaxID=246614 RepID=UPI003D9ED275
MGGVGDQLVSAIPMNVGTSNFAMKSEFGSAYPDEDQRNEDSHDALVEKMEASSTENTSSKSISASDPSSSCTTTNASSPKLETISVNKENEELKEKANAIKDLEEQLDQRKDYEDIKRELSVLKSELEQIKTSPSSDKHDEPLGMLLLGKTKALQTENAALRAANAELTGSLPRHLIPPFLPQQLQNVEAFGLVVGEEIAKAFQFKQSEAISRSQIATVTTNSDTVVNSTSAHQASSVPSRPTSADDNISITSEGSPTNSSAIACDDDQPLAGLVRTGIPYSTSDTPGRDPNRNRNEQDYILQRLQECLRHNVERFMADNLNTLNISRCVRELLSIHNIGQRLFAKFVLGLSQGTVSELLSKPKPWDKLTEKGRDSYRKMHAWAIDEQCISLLKSVVPRKGKEATTFKPEDPAAEERVRQILTEAQGAMLAPSKPLISRNSLVNGNSDPLNMRIDRVNDAASDNGDLDRNDHSPTSSSATPILSENVSGRKVNSRKEGDESMPTSDLMARMYEEGFTKMIGRQAEENFRPPHGLGLGPGCEQNPEQILRAFTMYRNEFARISQLISASGNSLGLGSSDPEMLARLTAASLMNGVNYLGLPHLMGAPGSSTLSPSNANSSSLRDPNKKLSTFSPSASPSDLSAREARSSSTPKEICDADAMRHHSSAFSLVRPKQEPTGSENHPQSASSSTLASSSPLAGRHDQRNASPSPYCSSPSLSSSTGANLTFNHATPSDLTSGHNNVGSAEDLSATASPLARMQSITNSLLSQSSLPPVSSSPSRPSKAILPPITQNQFDRYDKLNTEDIVKKVKEQLSQYSISQRLFGESVLGLSQGSVSDLLARPKPWHMLTQKGREPFIRMKMFLEDDNAVHKLVASQYKIAPEKLMRTGGYSGQNSLNSSTVAVAAAAALLSSSSSGPATPISYPVNSHLHSSSNLLPNSNSSNNTNVLNSTMNNSSVNLVSSKSSLKGDHLSHPVQAKNSSSDSQHNSSPLYGDDSGQLSASSTPEHTPSSNNNNLSITLLPTTHSPPRGNTSSSSSSLSSSYLKRRLDSGHSDRSSSLSYLQPSVYEMAALTQDLDTQAITTKIKETLMAHNIGQKIFGEIVLGLSQGSVSELLSKPKPWHMLSIKGREPFIRMQLWLTDSRNIERLQALKNERREMNKKRRNNGDESISSTKSCDMNYGQSALNHSINNTNSLGPLSISSSDHCNQLIGGSGTGGPNSNNSNNNNNNTPSSYGSSTKKPRILFSEEQKEALRIAFGMDAYPSTSTMEFLATELDLSVRTITNWFHNHRMRLKQISNAASASSGDDGGGSSPANQLPYNMGRDGVTFDPIRFRLALAQRLAEIKTSVAAGGPGNTGSNDGLLFRSKFPGGVAQGIGGNGGPYGSSSSYLYCNPNSCSSPASSSYQEDEVGTLDLSMSSQQHKSSRFSNRSGSDGDEDENSVAGSCDEEPSKGTIEIDLSRVSRFGSSRRKPAIVTSSSSRRKPAQPQWVAPMADFSGEEDEEMESEDTDREQGSFNNELERANNSDKKDNHHDIDHHTSGGSETEEDTCNSFAP